MQIIVSLFFTAVAMAQPADLILFNGKIVTGWAAKPVVGSVAIRDGKFVAVGDDMQAKQRIDLKGLTVLPGLIDSHTHPISAALSEKDNPIPVMNSIADVQADKVFDITPGTPKTRALVPGDTVAIAQSLDYEAVIAQASAAVADMVALTKDLHVITGGIVKGQGTLGQLVTNRVLYDQLNTTLGRANVMLAQFQNPNGTVGHLLSDPTLYNKLIGVIGSADSLVVSLNSNKGTAGLLLRDTTLYRNLVGITKGADSLMKSISGGQGTAGKLLTDQTLYDQLNKLVADLGAILADIRKDPSKYMKGVIKVF